MECTVSIPNWFMIAVTAITIIGVFIGIIYEEIRRRDNFRGQNDKNI